MVDIDLDLLNFIVNPSYDYIKDKIKLLSCAYIEEYGEEYREKIEKNLASINYVFYATNDDVINFISKFKDNFIADVYRTLVDKFEIGDNDNFIKKGLYQYGMVDYVNDMDLKIFRTDIRDFFIEIKNSTDNNYETKFLDDVIEYIDKVINKFDKIEQIFKSHLEKANSISINKLKLKQQLQKEFLKKHGYLLNGEEFDLLIDSNDIDNKLAQFNLEDYVIKSVFKDSVFELGDFSCFQENLSSEYFLVLRRNILRKYNVDYEAENIDVKDSDLCLKKIGIKFRDSSGVMQEGSKAMDALKEEINCYNKKYRDECDNRFRYLSSRESYISDNFFSDDILNRRCNSLIKDSLQINNIKLSPEDYFRIGNNFLSVIEGADYFSGNCCLQKLRFNNVFFEIIYVVVKNLLVDFQNKNGIKKISFNFFNTLAHELGHACNYGSCFGFCSKDKYRNLNELFNEYLSCKVTSRLGNAYFPNSCGFINENVSIHLENYFLLEPFMLEYEQCFKDASIRNDISQLVDVMGEDNLEEYVCLINEFYNKQEGYSYSSKIFEVEGNYILDLKEKIYDIYKDVKVRNGFGSRKRL